MRQSPRSLSWILRLAGLGAVATACSGESVGPAGAPGETGAAGTNGTACSVVDNGDGTSTVVCEDGTRVDLGADQRFRVIGRVIDQETRAPLLDAVVSLCGLGDARTDATGQFAIDVDASITTLRQDVPGDPALSLFLRVEAGGYAATEGVVRIFRPVVMTALPALVLEVADAGITELRRGHALTVVVTRTAAPIVGATVYAYLYGSLLDKVGLPVGPDGMSWSCRLEIVGVTDTAGVTTLPNLDPLALYEIIVPAQDLDDDGLLDFLPGRAAHALQVEGPTAAVNVLPVVSDGTITIIGSDLVQFPGRTQFSLASGPITDTDTSQFGLSSVGLATRSECRDETITFDDAIMTADGSVTLIFATPVSILGLGQPAMQPAFQFVDNLTAPPATSLGFAGFPLHVIPATAAGTGLDTQWTFTPTTPLAAHEVYELIFIAQLKNDTLEASRLRVTGLYRPPLSTSLAAPRLDNYNGTLGWDYDIGPAIHLEFDEVVEGTYQILEHHNGPYHVVEAAPVTRAFADVDDSAAYNHAIAPRVSMNAELGTTPGFRYRVLLRDSAGLPLLFGDSVAGNREVTLVIFAANAAGATYQQLVTLPVR